MNTNRTAQIGEFLSNTEWSLAQQQWLNQDASTRRYARLRRADGQTAILMDSPLQAEPPCPLDADEATRKNLGWYATARLAASRVDAFVVIAAQLRALGLSAPEVYTYDIGQGLCLLEDFGNDHEFTQHLADHPQDEAALYMRAVEALAHMHQNLPKTPQTLHHENLHWPLMDFDMVTARASMDVFFDWYSQYSGGKTPPAADWAEARDSIAHKAITQPKSFCFRDYHSQNLLWLSNRDKLASVGVLDFQDAIIGWDVWDLDLLLRDARRNIPTQLRDAATRHYCTLTGQDQPTLKARWAIIGTLNALRIVGVFSRLIKRDGRNGYSKYMAEQIAHLSNHLRHPEVDEMREFIAKFHPELIV